MKRLIAYFWPFGSYRDAEHGSMLERAAALRYNRHLSSALPTYITRWAVCGALEILLLRALPAAAAPVLAGLAVLLTVSICALLHLVRMWIVLRRGPF